MNQEQAPQIEQPIRPYEGLRHEVAMMCIDRAIGELTKAYNDDGTTPYVIRAKYGDIARKLSKLVQEIMKVDTLDKERQTPCYTVQDGKLVRVKLDDLIKLLQEQGGDL